MVFRGFAITGGHLGPVFHAIPHEMLIIGRAAAGALLLGNSMGLLKQVGGGDGQVFKGPTYFKQDYLDTIFLTAKLMKMLRTDGTGAMPAQTHTPQSSHSSAASPQLTKVQFPRSAQRRRR